MTLAGVDEVGCGAVAGPIIAVCVAIEAPVTEGELAGWWPVSEIRESKETTAAWRRAHKERVFAVIDELGARVGTGVSPAALINTIGHQTAWDRALTEATRQVREEVRVDLLIVDGSRGVVGYPWRQRIEPKADENYFVVAAASLLAKIIRDDMMADMARLHPSYGWGENKGYATPEHQAAILAHGLSPV